MSTIDNNLAGALKGCLDVMRDMCLPSDADQIFNEQAAKERCLQIIATIPDGEIKSYYGGVWKGAQAAENQADKFPFRFGYLDLLRSPNKRPPPRILPKGLRSRIGFPWRLAARHWSV